MLTCVLGMAIPTQTFSAATSPVEVTCDTASGAVYRRYAGAPVAASTSGLMANHRQKSGGSPHGGFVKKLS